jgi:hypothetical protein
MSKENDDHSNMHKSMTRIKTTLDLSVFSLSAWVIIIFEGFSWDNFETIRYISHIFFFLKFRCKVQVNENVNKNALAELFSSHSAYVVRKTARQSKNKRIPKNNLNKKQNCSHFLMSSFYFISKNKVGMDNICQQPMLT